MTPPKMSPEQWCVLQRLAAAGCPMDLSSLNPPSDPLRVIVDRAHSRIYPLPDGICLALLVRIIASTRITLVGYRLQADWLTAPYALVSKCLQHRDQFCVLAGNHHHSFGSYDRVINRHLNQGGQLKPGSYFQGTILGISATALPSEPELKATLQVFDFSGNQYPYPVQLSRAESLPGA